MFILLVFFTYVKLTLGSISKELGQRSRYGY